MANPAGARHVSVRQEVFIRRPHIAAFTTPLARVPHTGRLSRTPTGHACASYYVLEASKEIDNADERIAEDVRNFTRISVIASITLLNAAIDLVSFSAILISIHAPLYGEGPIAPCPFAPILSYRTAHEPRTRKSSRAAAPPNQRLGASRGPRGFPGSLRTKRPVKSDRPGRYRAGPPAD